MNQIGILWHDTRTVEGRVGTNVVPKCSVSPGRFEHQRVRRRHTGDTTDALTVDPGLAEHVDEARSQFVVPDVGNQLDGYSERVQITTGVRHAPGGDDRQRSDFDDRAGDDLLVATQLRTQVSADMADHRSLENHSSTSHRPGRCRHPASGSAKV